jgi:hypothetical protein
MIAELFALRPFGREAVDLPELAQLAAGTPVSLPFSLVVHFRKSP